ncbi:MAG TPA: Sec-independent protein translocase protein TatB [Paracoccus sp. (in: a-proteobacteria)]|nr:Sec-independent protein translocase protein TatB [Paracoccus sp. (in: a-proteobacteria)]
MLDVGWSELLLIGVVALIVIGPRDLPQMFHTLGRITARARGMAREFSSAMEDAARASGLDDATKELRDLQKATSPRGLGLDALGRAADKFEKWDPLEPVRNSAATPRPGATPAAGVQPPPAAPASSVTADVTQASAASGAPDPAPRTGARRLHAVRRGDRS